MRCNSFDQCKRILNEIRSQESRQYYIRFAFCYCFVFNVRPSRVFTTCDSAFFRIFNNQLSVYFCKKHCERETETETKTKLISLQTVVCIVKRQESVGLVVVVSFDFLFHDFRRLIECILCIINYKNVLEPCHIHCLRVVITWNVASAISYRGVSSKHWIIERCKIACTNHSNFIWKMVYYPFALPEKMFPYCNRLHFRPSSMPYQKIPNIEQPYATNRICYSTSAKVINLLDFTRHIETFAF